MDKKKLSELTDEELLTLKKGVKNTKIFNAVFIGFLIGILLFGVGASIIGKKPIGLLPMLIPVFLIYRFTRKSEKHTELEEALKKRKLD